MFWSRRSKRNSLGRNWSKHKYFGRSGQNVSSLFELGQNKKFSGRANRNISRLIELGRNIDVLVARFKIYLACSNLVEK